MFGFSKDIEIILDKYQFAPEDVINGKVILKLSKTVQAKGLFVSLVVTEKTRETSLSRNGVNASTSSTTREVFRFDLPLDVEREYTQGGEYPFSMQIPQEAWPSGVQGVVNDGGIVGMGLGLLANFSPLGRATRLYKVESRLDIPWAIDTTDSVDITIQ